MALQQYECPACGGFLEFDPTSQQMKCPYCDSKFETDAIKDIGDALSEETVQEDSFSWDENAQNEWAQGENQNLCSYICESCGGEIITDKTTAAASCPYCNNPVVMTNQVSGMLKPDFVVPFKLTKKQAIEAYKNHIKDKKLLPDVFKEQNHIDEIKGIYVPFWTYDANVNANARYKATKVRFWSDSNYNYTETSFFTLFRGGNIAFSKIPVDGSKKMADDLMESIEPFDTSEAVDFQTAYLSGYFADKYDVSAEECILRANERIKRSTVDALASTTSGIYTSVTPTSSNVNMTDGKTSYALYPVWILNTTWNGEKFTFAMNGQTGKFVGNLPIDKKKYRKYFAVSAALGSLVGFIGSIIFSVFFG